MNSHCMDQLVYSNFRSGFFQEANDQPVDTESVNYLKLLLFTFPFDNFQFSFFPSQSKTSSSLKLNLSLVSFFPDFISQLRLCEPVQNCLHSFCSEVQPHVPGTIQVGNPPAGSWSQFDQHFLSTPKKPHNHFVTFMAPILLQRTFPLRERP